MNAREYALNVLERVLYENGYASLILRKSPLNEQETAFAAQLIYTTVRQYDLLEAQWRPLAKGRVRRRTALLLDMTVCQLFFMDKVPAYAAVHEAVELAGTHDKKFVNAVLRAVQKNGLILPEGDTPEELALRFSHPEWIVRMWIAQYGKETAVRILEKDQTEHPVYGRINTLKEDPAFRKDPAVSMLENDAFIYDGVLTRTEYFRGGSVLVQDRSSQKVPEFLDVKDGMNVLDLCAAPGTKTQQTACLMHNTGQITACDLYEHRCSLIAQLMDRTGVTIVQTKVNDASVTGFEPESFDRILCDVPCSGLGDLSHKPEIRQHVRPQDLDALVSLQGKILEANADALKHGGILVYSTCTLNRRENGKQIEAFLKKRDDYTLEEEKTLFPFELESDGFYVAKLRRN